MNFLHQGFDIFTGTNRQTPAQGAINQGHLPREGFNNMGANLGVGKKPNYLPNLEPIPQNYPVENVRQVADTSLYQYSDPNSASNRFFDQNLYEERTRNNLAVGRDPQQIYSLNGNWMDTQEFKFNNMRPFIGGKVTGYTYDAPIAETILDNYVGAGSQVIRKIEQAPLFKPQANVQYPMGMPVQTDFIQSRMNPSMKDNSVKPFESIKVAPGLGLGYTSQGLGGFNSGNLVREQWLDKTVDELRVATNPKIEYDLFSHEGPAISAITNRGIIGEVHKNRPDTFFIQGQDRWFTTTGASKGEQLRPIQEMGIIRRDDCETFYPGPAGTGDGPQVGRAPTAFEPSRRIGLDATAMDAGAHATGRGQQHGNMENRVGSYSNHATNRSTTAQPRTYSSGFSTAIGAVLAPITDMLRPTKREEFDCGKVLFTSGAKYAIPKDPVYNPLDVAPTTIRETTLFGNTFNINNQASVGTYVDNAMPGALPQRATTSCELMGPVGGRATTWGDMNEFSYKNQISVDKTATLVNRMPQGAMGLFNPNLGSVCSKPDSNCGDPYFGAANSIIKLPGNTETFGHMSSRYHDDIPGSAARNQNFVVQQYLENPFIPAPFSLTASA
jgi:hypothetical protein